MVEMKKCSFCGGRIEPGTGKMYVRKDGTILMFCSSKCEKNARLGRIPRRTEWTEAGKEQKEKGR